MAGRGHIRRSPLARNAWADVPPDRGRGADLSRECVNYDLRTRPASCRLRDEPRATILVACSKCDWKAAFDRGELIATHGSNIGMVELCSGCWQRRAASKDRGIIGTYCVSLRRQPGRMRL